MYMYVRFNCILNAAVTVSRYKKKKGEEKEEDTHVPKKKGKTKYISSCIINPNEATSEKKHKGK